VYGEGKPQQIARHDSHAEEAFHRVGRMSTLTFLIMF